MSDNLTVCVRGTFGDDRLQAAAKDLDPSIKNNNFIYNDVTLSNYFWTPENGELSKKLL